MWLVLWQARVKDSRVGQKVPANLRPHQIELEYFPVLSCLGKLSGGLFGSAVMRTRSGVSDFGGFGVN